MRRTIQTIADIANEVEKEIKRPIVTDANTRVEFLNTGSTVLNLVVSGKGRDGGWARGRVVNIIGDGSSGKTLLALECAFLCFKKLNKKPETFPKVKKISIVYNNVEGVMDFPIEQMYGKEFEKAVEWIQLSTIEEFGRDYTRRVLAMSEGDFLLYITDSLDALVSEESSERFVEAAEKNKSEKDSYNMEKQKYAGKFFGNLCDIGKGKDATLIVISQVRDNIGVTFGRKLKRVGGKALDFYTHQCCWLAVKEKLKKTACGETRAYGIMVKAQLDRSKVSKPYREGDFIILFDYGVDDVLSNIIYVYGEKDKEMVFNKLRFNSKEKLVEYIEKHKLQDMLIDMVEDKWNKVEDGIKVIRERKF